MNEAKQILTSIAYHPGVVLSGIISFIILTICFTKKLDWFPGFIGRYKNRKKN